ncbi:MAG TPA: energy transducer TonB, partial [Bacteroidota bacterium]|nr:energy transducer TonB [Bacteroidota bacterium]
DPGTIGNPNTGNSPGSDVSIPDVDPGEWVPVQVYPVVVRSVMPEYPDLARRAGLEGTVWIKMLVDKEGRVKKTFVVKSQADVFNDAALNAAKQYLFTPAMMNNGPVAVWVTQPFRFSLKSW